MSEVAVVADVTFSQLVSKYQASLIRYLAYLKNHSAWSLHFPLFPLERHFKVILAKS